MIFIFFCQISQLRRNLWCLHRKPRKGNYQQKMHLAAFNKVLESFSSISKKLTKSSLSKRQLGRQGNKKERKKRERRTRSSFCALLRFWKSKLVNLLLFWTNWLLLNTYTIFSTCFVVMLLPAVHASFSGPVCAILFLQAFYVWLVWQVLHVHSAYRPSCLEVKANNYFITIFIISLLFTNKNTTLNVLITILHWPISHSPSQKQQWSWSKTMHFQETMLIYFYTLLNHLCLVSNRTKKWIMSFLLAILIHYFNLISGCEEHSTGTIIR